MISRFFALLTIAAMTLHSVVGCCWHHDHDVCTKSAHKEIRRPVGGCVAHRHHSHAHPGETPAEPCEHEHEVCQEAPCVYVAGKHFQLPAMAMTGVAVSAEVMELTPAALEASVLLSRTIEPTRPAAPELRALLQVWLV